jgi:hopanoid biosynthesis associated RND transporter like protein HpnN
MFDVFSKAYRNGLISWTSLVTRYAWWVVIVSALLTLFTTNYLAQNIRINTDTGDMLSAELDFRRHSEEISKSFPQFSDNLVIVIDGKTPDVADDAARTLTRHLNKSSEKYGRVRNPSDNDFLRRNGFLYLDIDEVYRLSDSLAEAQPFLGVLWRDSSLVGFLDILGLAIEEALKENNTQSIEISAILEAMNEVVKAQVRKEWGDLSWQELMIGTVSDEDKTRANRRILITQPPLDFTSLAPASNAMRGIRETVIDLGLIPENGVRVRLTGSAALSQEELESVKEGMGLAGFISLSLVILLLGLGLQSRWLVIATLVTLVMGLVWTAGFAILALGTLNLISVAFAVLFIGLSVDFGIHYGLRYKEEVEAGNAHDKALASSAEDVGTSLTLCAISAAIAFFSFLLTDYRGLAELGLIAGTGMFIALFANMTVLPAFLTVFPNKNKQIEGKKQISLSSAMLFNKRQSIVICMVGLIIGIASIFTLPRVVFDFDPMNLRDSSRESVATIYDLMEDKRTNPYSITILAESLEEAQVLADKLEKLEPVSSTTTLADYIPENQLEKLQIISTMELFLGPSFNFAEKIKIYTSEDRKAALARFRIKLDTIGQRLTESPEGKAAKKLSRAIRGLFDTNPSNSRNFDDAIKEFETRLIRALPGQLLTLSQALKAQAITLKNLPVEIRNDQVSSDGRAKLEVFATEDLRDRDALARFVSSVRTISPNASGSSVVILEAGNTVVRAFWQAGAISIILIFIVLLIVLKRFLNAVLVFIPLVLAALMTTAASMLFGLPFNFANIIVLPLLFGIGVAGGIHLVIREGKKGEKVFETSTPRAVLFSALTTIGSFGSIALSSHPGTSSMGYLLTISVILSLCCTLVVLPALMKVTKFTNTDKK